MKKKVKSIKVGTMFRAAQFDQATIDVEARTVELSFSSEEPYERYFGFEILGHSPGECNLDRLNNRAALLVCHDRKDQVGVIEKAWIGQDRKGRALVRFGKSARAEEIFQDVIDGIRSTSSVSYDPVNMSLVKSESVSGGKTTIDTYRVTSWIPLEVSLEPVPADYGVGVGREKEETTHDIIIELPKKEEIQKMEKCLICGADLVGSSCPVCVRAKEAAEVKMKDAERLATARVNDILAMAKKHDLMDDAQAYIAGGKSVQEFKDLVIEKISAKKIDLNVGENTAARKPYRTFGEQLVDVAHAEMTDKPGSALSRERLLTMERTITGMSTSFPTDGGFLVQQDFTTKLLDKMQETGKVAPRCEKIPIGQGFDGLEAPFVDETSRASGSRWGGLRVYRAAEAVDVTATKVKVGLWELRLWDLKGLCYVTNRALQDATSLEAIVMKGFQSEFAFKLDDEIINGTGDGQCLGVLNAPALISVAKDTGQKGATISVTNINNMFNALFADSRGSAVWFYNQEVEPQLEILALEIGTGGVAWPLWQPAGMGMNNTSTAKLKGIPAVPIEQCAALGTKGDLILMDPTGYILIDKGGVDAQQSIHVRFINDEMTYRFNYRVNGAPRLRSAITAYKGSTTHSHMIALATRA